MPGLVGVRFEFFYTRFQFGFAAVGFGTLGLDLLAALLERLFELLALLHEIGSLLLVSLELTLQFVDLAMFIRRLRRDRRLALGQFMFPRFEFLQLGLVRRVLFALFRSRSRALLRAR